MGCEILFLCQLLLAAAIISFVFFMTESTLLPELIAVAAQRTPQAMALTSGAASMNYGDLGAKVNQFASGLMGLGLLRAIGIAT